MNKGWTPSEGQWSQFFRDLLPTNRKTDSSNETYSDRIFVVAIHYSDAVVMQYFLYNIDLSCASKDIRSVKPLCKIYGCYGRSLYQNYTVVGSKLFMMGALDVDEIDSGRTSWCWCDLSDAMHRGTVKEKYLKMGPPMEGKKLSPIVAVVGSDKICVFAKVLYAKVEAGEKDPRWGPPNFEVFDTQAWCWTTLPELVSNYSECKLDWICVRSYCIEGSCIVICTDIGIYGINIDADCQKWVKMEGSGRVDRSPFSGRWVKLGKNVCNPSEMARMGEVGVCRFPFQVQGYRSGVLCSERVENENSVILCSVQGRVTRCEGLPAVHVRVVKFDNSLLEESGGDMSKAIQSDKSSVFEIECESCDNMELEDCWFQSKETELRRDEDEPAVENLSLEALFI